MGVTAVTIARITRRRIGATDYAHTLAGLHGCGRRFCPVPCWIVANSKIIKADITMVRGSSDYYSSRDDYAESSDGRVFSSRYIFPRSTHKRPALFECADDMGVFHDWASDPKR